MKLINKSRGTGKTTQLIYASAITGFRIIAPNAAMAKNIEKMAKDMGVKILPPMSDVEYRNKKELWDDHTPILIDEIQNQILDEALELYFNAPVVAATMTVPIDDNCFPPTLNRNCDTCKYRDLDLSDDPCINCGTGIFDKYDKYEKEEENGNKDN